MRPLQSVVVKVKSPMAAIQVVLSDVPSGIRQEGKYITSGFEYETIWGLGADACIKDLDAIAYIDRAMDDIGIDSIETAVAIATAMEGGLLPWGDGKRYWQLLMKLRSYSSWTNFASGTALLGKVCGLFRVPVVKNQAIPAYDPRPLRVLG